MTVSIQETTSIMFMPNLFFVTRIPISMHLQKIVENTCIVPSLLWCEVINDGSMHIYSLYLHYKTQYFIILVMHGKSFVNEISGHIT